MKEKKLTRSVTDQQIAGVCAGIAHYFDIDPTVVRVLTVILVFVGVGSVIPVYILLALVMPEADATTITTDDTAMLHDVSFEEELAAAREVPVSEPR
ncbi:MAG: PspC domain-containing protein [Anaerolineales bacterium]|nr:PspC domain-containing protein [Anaerolineales bacterium]